MLYTVATGLLLLLLRLACGLAMLLPSTLAAASGRGLGWFWFHIVRIRRTVVEANLAQALGLDRRDPRLHRLARANFLHYGQFIMEIGRIRRLRRPAELRRVGWYGVEHLRQAWAKGRGLLVLTAHLGNFVTMVTAGAEIGLPIGIVIKRVRSAAVEKIWVQALGWSGVEVLFNRESMGDILRQLRRNRMVGFMLDQHDSRHGVWAPFFGRPAATFRALAVLAQRRGQCVVPAFTHRLADGSHRVEIEPPLPPPGPGEAAVEALVQRMLAVTEAAIRRHPEQWTWIHRRWKTPPADNRLDP